MHSFVAWDSKVEARALFMRSFVCPLQQKRVLTMVILMVILYVIEIFLHFYICGTSYNSLSPVLDDTMMHVEEIGISQM